jgi:hypothetical protein
MATFRSSLTRLAASAVLPDLLPPGASKGQQLSDALAFGGATSFSE